MAILRTVKYYTWLQMSVLILSPSFARNSYALETTRVYDAIYLPPFFSFLMTRLNKQTGTYIGK